MIRPASPTSCVNARDNNGSETPIRQVGTSKLANSTIVATMMLSPSCGSCV